MTTLLLKASRVLELPGQRVRKDKKLDQSQKSIVALLKTATLKKEKSLQRKADSHQKEANRSFSASDIELARYQQTRSLL